MSRITKEIAHYVAKQLCAKKLKEVEQNYIDLQTMASDSYLKKIPKDVLDFYSKNKNYCKTTCSFKLVGFGWNHEYINFGKELPSKDGNYITITLDEKTSVKLLALYNKHSVSKIEYSNLIEEIETALKRLSTYKRVELEFKEAFLLLPKSVSQSLVVNIDKIREKL